MRMSKLLVCGALLVWVPACSKTSGTGAAKEDMQLVPRETDIVLMANVTRMRNTQMWRKVLDLRDSDEKNKKDYEEFVAKCGLDPFKHIDSVFIALPQQGGGAKEFAGILRGSFDETKLVACAREQAKKDGSDVTAIDYNGKKLYTDTKKGEAFATFLDGKTVAVGGKEWIKRVVDLAGKKDAGPSAKQNDALIGLMKRTKTSEAMWGAGVVPESARESLKNDPNLAAAASMKNVFGSIDFASGFAADINVDTASDADAKELAAKVTGQLMETRKSPQMMMMGLAGFLDGVKVDAKGPTFHVGINFTQQQVDDLINRVKGLMKTFGAAIGGGGPPGMAPGMPPGGPGPGAPPMVPPSPPGNP
jgi:hypothetical protein